MIRGIIVSLLIIVLYSCSSTVNEKKTISETTNVTSSDSLVNIQTEESFEKLKGEETAELIKKWTWNDKISMPLKSSISNAKYSSELLLKTWTWADDNQNLPALIFKKDSLTIPGERKYLYTVNHDSLRIFTSYEHHPGDGFTRGIITKLTKDSLIIKWSSDDINKYVSIHDE